MCCYAHQYVSSVVIHIHTCLCHVVLPVDFITVSETAVEPPQDEEGMNSPTDLAMEATFINQNFSQQVLKRVSGFVVQLNSNLFSVRK